MLQATLRVRCRFNGYVDTTIVLKPEWLLTFDVKCQHIGVGRTYIQPEGRGAMTRLVARMWVPFVMVVVLAIAALTVARLHGVFGSKMYRPDNGNADAIIQFNPKHVLLEIFGAPGTVADINYLDEQAQPQRVNGVTLPWSFEIVTTLTAVLANVIAQGDGDSIGCRITVNGVVRDQQSENRYHAQTSCLVKSA